jgi:hypothetical protein
MGSRRAALLFSSSLLGCAGRMHTLLVLILVVVVLVPTAVRVVVELMRDDP